MNLLVTIGKKQHHLSVKPGTPLPEALALLGFPIALPCGGKGSCGKCRVKATGQLSPITPAERRCLSAGELRNGLRLLCQTAVLGEARIELPEESAEDVYKRQIIRTVTTSTIGSIPRNAAQRWLRASFPLWRSSRQVEKAEKKSVSSVPLVGIWKRIFVYSGKVSSRKTFLCFRNCYPAQKQNAGFGQVNRIF